MPNEPKSLLEIVHGGVYRAMDNDDSTVASHFMIRVLGALLPVAYIWSLPLLAYKAIGFVHVQEDCYPHCGDIGASVSDYISSTSATGMMYAVFFYPCLHAWLNVRVVSATSIEKLTVILFQVSFNLFLMFPVTKVPTLHFLAVGTFGAVGLYHFYIVSEHCVPEMRKAVKVLMVTALVSLLGVVGCKVVSSIDALMRGGESHLLSTNLPFLFYLFEVVGLSSIALLTMCMKAEDWPEYKIRSYSYAWKWWSRALMTVPSVCFFVLLPLFGHTCEGFPRCGMYGSTLWDYIDEPELTGCFGAAMFYPCLHAWLNMADFLRPRKDHRVEQLTTFDVRAGKATIVGFQVFFGLTLAFANYKSGFLWLPQLIFSLFAIAHLLILLRLCPSGIRFNMWFCSGSGIVIFSAVQVLTVVGHFDPEFLPYHAPYLYYILEAMGFSVLALTPAVFHVDVDEHLDGDEKVITSD